MTVWMIVAMAILAQGYARAAQDATETSSPKRVLSHQHGTANGLDERVKLLTASLSLDVDQQAQVRKILEKQREQIQAVWNDTAIPAARRVSATQAISDRTADAIRVLLNEEQKRKYSPPKPARDPQANSDNRSVEDWMNAAQPKQ
jgi:hypothetical protein